MTTPTKAAELADQLKAVDDKIAAAKQAIAGSSLLLIYKSNASREKQALSSVFLPPA